MHKISKAIIKTIKNKGTVFACGNGGSAMQASHFISELLGKFEHDRMALPAVSLCSDIATITAVANDYGYEDVFKRQLQGLSKPGDVLVTFSTSGKSVNVLEAEMWAKGNDLKVYRLPTRMGEESTAQCQERHLKLLHLIAREVELQFI